LPQNRVSICFSTEPVVLDRWWRHSPTGFNLRTEQLHLHNTRQFSVFAGGSISAIAKQTQAKTM
jgi:hypothetical protein